MQYVCPNSHVIETPKVERNLLTDDPRPIYDPFLCCPICGDYPLEDFKPPKNEIKTK